MSVAERGSIARISANVRRLQPEDAASLVGLRREALVNHPLAFGASPDDDRGLSLEFVRTALGNHREQAVFGYLEGRDLAGMVGMVRASTVKRRHQAEVSGMYVTPPARRKGVGRALLEAVITQARAWPGVEQVHLSVTDAAIAARRLYECAGFRVWGTQPRALQWEGRFVDEAHLVLELGESEHPRPNQP